MMLPLSLVTTGSAPWLSVSSDPAPQLCWWLTSWSAATPPATPPLFICPPAMWIPDNTHLWEFPTFDFVPVLPLMYRAAPLHHHHHHHHLNKEVGVFHRREKRHLTLTTPIIPLPCDHAPRTRLLPPSPHLAGVAYVEWAGLREQRDLEAWPLVGSIQRSRRVQLRPLINLEARGVAPVQFHVGPVCPAQLCLDTCPVSPVQLLKELCPPGSSSRPSIRLTLLSNYRRRKRRALRGDVSPGRALLLRAQGTEDTVSPQGAVADQPGEDGEKEGSETGSEEEGKDKRPVASTPVPGSPWCVVWTADDQIFFFNPTMHLSVWERPGDLTGSDISRIIQDPPHKRRKTGGLPGDEDEQDSKRNTLEEPGSLAPHPGEIQPLPLELRTTHFKEMMLERGVSAFSSWDKELHKMVFDRRYLLLSPEQRKQVFDQFVKSRMKEEFKEKKSQEQKIREGFRKLLEEAKITSRSTFKEFWTRYHGDQRFKALKRKKEQEVLFSHYITSLKRRDKENRARLRKMR